MLQYREATSTAASGPVTFSCSPLGRLPSGHVDDGHTVTGPGSAGGATRSLLRLPPLRVQCKSPADPQHSFDLCLKVLTLDDGSRGPHMTDNGEVNQRQHRLTTSARLST